MDLYQNLNYEWIGTFWFSDKDSDIFTDKVAYSTEQGIKLTLSRKSENIDSSYMAGSGSLSGKLMNAAVSGNRTVNISLVNVWLNPTNTALGNSIVTIFNGRAELLVDGYLLEKDRFNMIEVACDDFFNNLFLSSDRKVGDMLKLSKSNPITLQPDSTLVMDLCSSAERMWSVDDLDSIIWALDKTKMEKLKEVARPVIEDGIGSFFQRKKSYLSVSFSIKKGDYILGYTHSPLPIIS
ncbi:MAG: hypothetical protein OXH90_02925 [Paracoccaceae bacterium]|nr:hypothetical protein [Paracoccaceae bacterium]MDE2916539.1 hypothetical protein [Paracoccaceae bacterium]